MRVFAQVAYLATYWKEDGTAFNLDFYTEVQDLSFLDELLEKDQQTVRGRKFAELNRVICELVEDYGLVGFETLCVEVRRSVYLPNRMMLRCRAHRTRCRWRRW